MAKSHQALVRYRVIDLCLKDFECSTIQPLKETSEETLSIKVIGLRTIVGDIHEMCFSRLLGYYAANLHFPERLTLQ